MKIAKPFHIAWSPIHQVAHQSQALIEGRKGVLQIEARETNVANSVEDEGEVT
jgi:hypothetical protein